MPYILSFSEAEGMVLVRLRFGFLGALGLDLGAAAALEPDDRESFSFEPRDNSSRVYRILGLDHEIHCDALGGDVEKHAPVRDFQDIGVFRAEQGRDHP